MPKQVVQTLVVVMLLVGALPARAQNACDAGKLKCARLKFGCLVKVYEVSQKKGLPPDGDKLQKCRDKFDGGADPATGCFAKVEAKPGAACSTTGNTTSIENQVDQDVDDLVAALDLTSPPPSTTSTSTTTVTSPSPSTTSTSIACTPKYAPLYVCNGNYFVFDYTMCLVGGCQQFYADCASNQACINAVDQFCNSHGCITVGSCVPACQINSYCCP